MSELHGLEGTVLSIKEDMSIIPADEHPDSDIEVEVSMEGCDVSYVLSQLDEEKELDIETPKYTSTPKKSSSHGMQVEDRKGKDSEKEKKHHYPDCPYRSAYQSDLKRHRRCHAKEESYFACDMCGSKFIDKYKLRLHIESVHQGKKYICDQCCKEFTSKRGLKRHVEVSHVGKSNFVCSICNKVFFGKLQWEGHMNGHLKYKPYKCTVCKKGYQYKSSLDRHTEKCSKTKLHSCSVCRKACANRQGLKEHMQAMHEGKLHKCGTCNLNFRWRSSLCRHQSRAKHD